MFLDFCPFGLKYIINIGVSFLIVLCNTATIPAKTKVTYVTMVLRILDDRQRRCLKHWDVPFAHDQFG